MLSPRAPDLPAELVLGTMNFGKRTDRPTSLRILAEAFDAGIRHIDTANMYVDGESERIVGQAIKGRRDQVYLATKVGFARQNGRAEGLSPASLIAACDTSLMRLGVDNIDLYYLHLPDPNTPVEATVDGVGTLLHNGKIKAWGVSNFASWQILELNILSDRAGLPRPVAAQQVYNALVRQLDIEYFAFAERYPISTCIYNPLAAGMLSGAYQSDSVPPPGSRFDRNAMYRRRYWQPALFRAIELLTNVATNYQLSLIELAYAFVFRHPDIHSVVVGPATSAHLAAAVAAQSVELSPEARAQVDQVNVALMGTDVRYAR